MAVAAPPSQSDIEEIRRRLETDPAPSPQTQTEQAVMRGIFSFLGSGSAPSSLNIPLKHRYEMRADGIIAYAHLLALKAQLTAKSRIRCASARKAEFVDQCLRRIYGGFVIQASEARYFGWQAMVKEFEDLQPSWEYLDRNEDGEVVVKKVWPDDDIPAKVWAPFTPLRPETVRPSWTPSGRFGGIFLGDPGPWSFPTIPVVEFINGDQVSGSKVPVDQSLWIVNNRHQEFGSIWGSPRTQTVYRFWRAYEAALAVVNVAVQRKGDPLWLILYPTGTTPWGPENKDTPNGIIARQIAQQARSGSVLTLPSEMYAKDEGGAAGAAGRQWSIEAVKFEDNIDKLVDYLKYLDVMKFRSMFISELSVAEGSGGTSSRNVASVTGSSSDLLQFGAQLELDDQINRYMIPQLSMINLPPDLRYEPAIKETMSFGDEDAALAAEILHSIANADPKALPVDTVSLLKKFNIDVLDPKSILHAQKEAKEAVDEAAQRAASAKPPASNPKPGQAGVDEQTGFYIEPQEHLQLGDDSSFLASIPPTRHYQDMAVVQKMREVRSTWLALLSDQYEDLARVIERGDLELGDVALAEGDQKKRARQIADKIMGAWRYDADRVKGVVKRTREALFSIFSRAGEVELKGAGLSTDDWRPDEVALKRWVDKNTGALIKSVEGTTRKRMRAYLAQAFAEDKNAKQVADGLRAHFSGTPAWRADLIAREETRRFYNAASLFAAEQQGVKVQALDARLGEHRSDPTCVNRNGKVMDVGAAWRAESEEHVRGTLAWRLLRVDVQTRVVNASDQEEAARIDRDAGTIYLREDLGDEEAGNYMLQAVDWITALA